VLHAAENTRATANGIRMTDASSNAGATVVGGGKWQSPQRVVGRLARLAAVLEIADPAPIRDIRVAAAAFGA
jgi:hypothetical protein